jgi:hypothetical protein
VAWNAHLHFPPAYFPPAYFRPGFASLDLLRELELWMPAFAGSMPTVPHELATPTEIGFAIDIVVPPVSIPDVSMPDVSALPGLPEPLSPSVLQVAGITLEITSSPAPRTPDEHALETTRAPARDAWAGPPSPTATHDVASAQSQPDARAPRPAPDARRAPQRQTDEALSLFALPRTLNAGGSSQSTGGTLPNPLTFGFATVIGFIVLPAPGLGRRIRLARHPSPRNRFHSPLDRPG